MEELEEITNEENHLIAEYLGAQWYEDRWRIGYGEIKQYLNHATELKFDVDWNWLLIVVKQVMDSYTSDMMFDKTAGPLYTTLKNAIMNIDREEVFNAVVDFVRWHNEQLEEEDV